jgi:F0F1-type ATP synthase membrane subunit a
VETLRGLIRRVTLPGRLFANLRVGHLLLETALAARGLAGLLFLGAEIGVALIQAVVFTLLFLSYMEE